MRVTDDRQRLSGVLIVVLAALTAVGPLTINLYLPAFPEVAADLGASDATVQLTMTAMLAGLGIGQLVLGSLSDAFGRRRPLLVAFACYVVASLGIAVAPGIAVIVVLRLIQGLTAAAGMVIALAVVRDVYHGVAVGKAIARLMLVVGLAPVLAPALGSLLLRVWSWRALFVVLAAAGLLLIVVVVRWLPETLPPEQRRTGGAAGALAAYRGLLTDRYFTGLVLVGGFVMAGQFSYVSSSTFVFQDGFGLSPQQFGLVFGVGAVTVTIGTQVTGALLGRVGGRRLLTVILGAAVAASSLLVVVALTTADSEHGFWWFLAAVLLTIGTFGATLPAVPAIALARQHGDTGSAAALVGGGQFVMASLAAPLTGLLGQSAATMAWVMVALFTTAFVVLLGTRAR